MAEKIAAAIAEFIAAGGVITPTTTIQEIMQVAKAAQSAVKSSSFLTK